MSYLRSVRWAAEVVGAVLVTIQVVSAVLVTVRVVSVVLVIEIVGVALVVAVLECRAGGRGGRCAGVSAVTVQMVCTCAVLVRAPQR